jgi:prepilin-type N-terminal cleavage/methylation domain-containing protein
MVNRAFTLIELLIVIAVILILCSLVLVGVDSLKKQARKARTATVLQTCLQSLMAGEQANFGSPAPIEHPLAGSALLAGQRPRFQRQGLGDLDTAGIALDTLVPEKLANDTLRRCVLLRDDRFADPAMPHLFGMPRGRLRILGAPCKLVSVWRSVPDDGRATWTQTEVDKRPITDHPLKRYKYEGSIEETADPLDPDPAKQIAWEEAGDRVLALALREGVERLVNLKAIRRCDALRAVDPDPLILGGRVREDCSATGRLIGAGDTWAPGRVKDGTWKPWIMRGPMIVDDWGGEVLISLDVDKTIRMESAGPDGCFAIHPGPDGVLDTTDTFGTPVGNDREASQDNIVRTSR